MVNVKGSHTPLITVSAKWIINRKTTRAFGLVMLKFVRDASELTTCFGLYSSGSLVMLTHVSVYVASRPSLAGCASSLSIARYSGSRRCAMDAKVFSEGSCRAGHDQGAGPAGSCSILTW